MPGILSKDSVLSAIEGPYIGYHATIYEKAAALLRSLVCNHGFADGNKRTAFLLTELLLIKSGYQLAESDSNIKNVILEVAKGSMTYDDHLVAWFPSRVEKR